MPAQALWRLESFSYSRGHANTIYKNTIFLHTEDKDFFLPVLPE